MWMIENQVKEAVNPGLQQVRPDLVKMLTVDVDFCYQYTSYTRKHT